MHFYYMLPIVGAFYVESFCVLGNYERVVCGAIVIDNYNQSVIIII